MRRDAARRQHPRDVPRRRGRIREMLIAGVREDDVERLVRKRGCFDRTRADVAHSTKYRLVEGERIIERLEGIGPRIRVDTHPFLRTGFQEQSGARDVAAGADLENPAAHWTQSFDGGAV